MQSKELHARELRRSSHSSGNCIRDVVEFQVEEDSSAQGRKHLDCLRALGGEECAADLEQISHAAQLPCQLEGWPQAVDVERDD